MNATLSDYKLSCELLGHSLDVRALAAGQAAPDGQVIISGSRDKTVKVWKPAGKEYNESVTYQDHKNFVSCICYMVKEKWICTGSHDATICIYNEGAYVPILILKGHESAVCSIAGGFNNSSLLSGSWDKTARVWQIDQLGGFSFITLTGHEAAVWSVAAMQNVRKYITGSADRTIYYWNEKGVKLRMLKGHTDCVRDILTFTDNTLVSCANDATIRYWNEESECVREMTGHTNYIYALAQNKALGDKVIVSCGEDSTIRMWNVETGEELGSPIVHPAQSVWSIACLNNGDIVTGCSDGIVRIFTKDPTRVAEQETLTALNRAVAARQIQMNEELGGFKKTDLPGPEALLNDGNRDGQTKMVRHPDGIVKCYMWELGKWTLVGDVTGASGGSQGTSGKTLYEGKEYDYVFSVDVAENQPPIKLPYNNGDDPWHAAQVFIDRHNLPQAFLDQVANFVIKNSDTGRNRNIIETATTSGYQDPFTGGSRYVPGMSNSNFQAGGNLDPFTGASSYSTLANQQVPKADFIRGADRHFPVSKFLTFDNYDAVKILDKLREFNNNLKSDNQKVSDVVLQGVITLTDANCEFDRTTIEALQMLLHWPSEVFFPVLDVIRLAIRNERIFTILNSQNFLQIILPQIHNSAANQLMTIRCLANMMSHAAGRVEVEKRISTLVEQICTIKSGSNNLQIAIATLYLNVTVSQTLGLAVNEKCAAVTEGLVELLKWASDLEACYRAMQAIGNLTTTPFGQETIAIVISVDYVMDKIRELANTPQTGVYSKINSAGTALLAAF